MFNLILIPHSNISSEYLQEIIRIKSVAWPYSYEEQIKWITDNLKESDIHVLLAFDKYFIAYLNLISVDLEINGKIHGGLGVGNVCTKEKGKGWGKELMMRSNSVIQKADKVGLLFCKSTLVDFYSKCNWEIMDDKKLNVGFNNNEIVTMYFNYNNPIQLIKYFGMPF
jgi:hypothetical protein